MLREEPVRGVVKQLGVWLLALASMLLFVACGPAARAPGWYELDVSSAPRASLAGAVAYDSIIGAAVLFGGQWEGGWLNETWLWQNGQWRNLTPAESPEPREKHAMAYDPIRGRVVLFGGVRGEDEFQDTWEWDGANWHRMEPVHTPGPRCCHAMAFDPSLQAVILHGGWRGSTAEFFADTWAWDGEDWKLVDCCSSPLAAGHNLATLGESGPVVAFMTAGAGTWLWDGTSWQAVAEIEPPPVSDGRLVAASDRGWAVLFGGLRPDGPSDEVWVFDGARWYRLAFDAGPSGRWGHVMFFDARRSTVIVFGGLDEAGTRLGDTWELVLPDELPPSGAE